VNEILGLAVLAHRNGKFQDAIDLLLQLLQTEKENWLAWFYLGMSYAKLGTHNHAHRIFQVIMDKCPDQELVQKAQRAVPALEAAMVKRVPVEKKGPQRYDLDSTDLSAVV